MPARRLVVALAVLGTLSFVLDTASADWLRFRGPNGSGVADQLTPLTWSDSAGLAWKTPIPGIGNSSPIVVGNKVFLQSATKDGSKRMLYCLDAKTGRIAWTKEVPGAKVKTHAKNTLASSTPASDGERVYALFWDGRVVTLHAYDLAGNELWSSSLGPYASQHGAGMSPVVYGGKVFVNYDQDDLANIGKDGKPKKNPAPLPPGAPSPAELLAFDAKTGAKLWAAKRKPFRACSSSPLIRELPNGKAEVIVSSTAGLAGYDPDTGAANWEWEWKFAGMALRTVGSPVLADGVIVTPSGDGGGSRALVVVTAGPNPKLLWEKTKETPYVPGPLVKGDHIYWITDGGFAFCLELKTGKVVWGGERVFPNLREGSFVHSSPILVGDNVVAVAETGEAVVFKASPAGYQEVARNNLGEPVTASVAASDGKLFIRGSEHLFCIGKK
jgi:outer membrane protein assembly factor BamB